MVAFFLVVLVVPLILATSHRTFSNSIFFNYLFLLVEVRTAKFHTAM